MKKQKLHFSRLLSLVLSLALLCTALSVPFSVSAADDTPSGTSATTIWDGDVADAADLSLKDTSNPTNSAANPYLIDCAEKLAYIARASADATNGRYYELTCDIYLNNVTGDNWYDAENQPKQWFDKGESTARFQGKLNGNGHVIYGIYIDDDTLANAGLFIKTEGGASISNLGIEKSYIKGKTNVGAFAGSNNNWHNLDLINCYSSDTVILSSYDNYTSWQTSIGGLIGVLNASNDGDASQLITIENCYSAAIGSDKDHMGGLFGKALTSAGKVRIANCYSSQDSMTMIGFTNYISGGTFENNYSKVSTGIWNGTALDPLVSSELTTAKMTGKAAYENMIGYDFNSVWYVFDGITPKLRVFGVIKPESEIWDGETVATELSLKDPSQPNSATNPYLISNGAELAYFVKYGVTDVGTNSYDNPVFTTYGIYFELTNDIYLNNVSTNWYDSAYTGDRSSLNKWTNCMSHSYTKTDSTTGSSVPGFSGTLDGKGYKIYGLYTDGITRAGLLYDGNNCKIKNLGIEKSYILGTSNNNAGAFLSQHTWGNDTFNNCYVSDTVTVKAHKAGGFVGYSGNKIIFTDCYSSANVETASESSGYLAAFVSQNETADSTFTRCFSTQSNLCFVGYNKALVFNYVNCYAMYVPEKETSAGSGVYEKVITDESKLKQLNPEQMLGNGMENLVNATDSEGKLVWYTKPNSTPIPAVFPIDGDVNGDKTVDIRDLIRIKKVCIGTVGYNLINFDNTNLDNDDNLYTINSADIIKLRKRLLGVDF